jgi:hypothetical protein
MEPLPNLILESKCPSAKIEEMDPLESFFQKSEIVEELQLQETPTQKRNFPDSKNTPDLESIFQFLENSKPKKKKSKGT